MSVELNRLQEVFLAVAPIADAAERAAALDRACGDDVALRQGVERLLAAHLDPAALPGTAAGTAAEQHAITDPVVGEVFAGRYKLREKLGEGGMGVVFIADQTEPVHRRVALKIIRSNLPSEKLLARFEQERQALALMDHPNIAKVFDAGIVRSDPLQRVKERPAEAGHYEPVPYFVMELVKGVSLTRYCDDARLTPQQRLELFIPVCQAVQHAHQKGIIHRDLKPSNIIVGLYDGVPVPKVIDFGVAKMSGPRLTEHSVYTEVGTMVGTLEYMSPEQAELNNLDIDTRSDIYALGVILYELLTGTVPFARQDLQKAGFVEMLRIIKEQEPPRPSTRLSSSGSLPSVAAVRQMEPARLTKLVRGELDWIVMKALEKDRTRRYDTANSFAMDVQRYLTGEPVLAVPPSTGYRLRKFARKHRAALTTAAVIVALLILGVAVSSWLAIRATRAEEQARANEEAALNAAAAELRERDKAQAINNFLINDLLAEAAPENNPVGSKVTVRELLDKAAQKIGKAFAERPESEAAIRRTIGRTYMSLGLHSEAERHLREALRLHQQVYGPEQPETLNVMNALVYSLMEARKREEAEHLARQCLSICERALGPEHQETLAALVHSADIESLRGRHAEAERIYRSVLEIRRRLLGPEHRDTLTTMDGLAVELYWQANYAEAEELYRQVLETRRRAQGPEHPATLNASHNLVLVLDARGKQAEALPVAEKALEARRRVLGPEHPHTLGSLSALAGLHRQLGKLRQAEALFREMSDSCNRTLGAEHDLTLSAQTNLAQTLSVQGRLAEAEPLFRQALAVRSRLLDADHPLARTAMGNLASVLHKQGRLQEAEELYRKDLKDRQKVDRADPHTLWVMNNLADLLLDKGQPAEAERLCQAAVEGRRKLLPPQHRGIGYALVPWARSLVERGDFDRAEPALREAIDIFQKTPRDGDWEPAYAQGLLGVCYAARRDHAKAEPLLLAGYRELAADALKRPEVSAMGTPGRLRLTRTLEHLVKLYEATGKNADAARWRKELEAVKAGAKSVEKK